MKGFDLMAPIYDKLGSLIFGSEICKAQIAFLDKIKDGDNILIIGGGTGSLLENIRTKVDVTYIDLSPEMINLAKGRNFSCNVKFITGTYADTPQEEFDVIITPFFLDLFTTSQVFRITETLSQKLKTNGLWLFIDFQKTNKIGHKLVLWVMYRFFRLTCGIEAKKLPDFSKVFTSSFILLEEKIFFKGMIVSKILEKAATGKENQEIENLKRGTEK